LLADWVKEHTYKVVSFENLMEADGVIYLGRMLAPSIVGDWHPRTYVYAQRGLRQVPLFDAARDAEYAKRLLVLFGHNDINELKASVLEKFSDYVGCYGDARSYCYSALNVKEWATL